LASTVSFPWLELRDPKLGRGFVSLARMNLRSARGTWSPVDAVVDSGASVTLLKRSICDVLGYRFRSGALLSLGGVGAGSVHARLHRVTAAIGHNVFKMPVAFAPDDRLPNLLGRAGVFSIFEVLFSARTRATSFRRR
jgi:hypothetical protein